MTIKIKLLLIDILFVVSLIIIQVLMVPEMLSAFFSLPWLKMFLTTMLIFIWLILYNAISLYIFLASLKKVKNYIKKIGQGDLSLTIAADQPKNELNDLLEAINKMRLNLASNIKSLDEYKELENRKSEFVLISSHQLRTPLTSVRWGLEALNKNSNSLNQEQKQALLIATAASQQASLLVNQLLATAENQTTNSSAGKKEFINITQLTNNIISQLNYLSQSKGIKILFSAGGQIPEINFEPLKIKSIIQNLLENAIHYSDNGSVVTVNLSASKEKIKFAVANTGLMISDKDKIKIFTKFYRGRDAVKQRPSGSGLGLFLVNSLVQAAGGKVWFKNGPKDNQTTFYFTLPLSAEAKVNKFLKSF